MLKKIIVCLGILLSLSSQMVYASENLSLVNALQESYLPNNGKDFTTITEEQTDSRANYITLYKHAYTKGSAQYGSWRNCTAGYGPGNVQCNRSYDKSYNISFTATVSGSYDKGATIGGDLGVTLGSSKNYSLGSGFSTDVSKGKHVTIQYRPVYYKYKVVETKYQEAYLPGHGWHRPVLGTKTCYVNVFSHWEFRPVFR